MRLRRRKPRLVGSLPVISPVNTVDLMTEVTRILREIDEGNLQVAAQLLPLVYDELRRLAATLMANEAPGITLNAAALVKLRLFAGLTQEEAAAALGVVRRTADRDWAFARAWLFRQLSGNPCRILGADGA
jgi:predicted DNA-binding protein (UPF0251 family)